MMLMMMMNELSKRQDGVTIILLCPPGIRESQVGDRGFLPARERPTDAQATCSTTTARRRGAQKNNVYAKARYWPCILNITLLY